MSKRVWIDMDVCVNFPYEPYECQRVLMKTVIDALNANKDVALESPRKTGKTLALLCSTLAWVQQEKKSGTVNFEMGKDDSGSTQPSSSPIPAIYYASSSHSQLEEVIEELNKTEYKCIRTCILGNDKPLCISPQIEKIDDPNRQAQVCGGIVSKKNCRYYSSYREMYEAKTTPCLNEGQSTDIEELIEHGKNHSMCPYYMSQRRSETAELFLVTYDHIIDLKTRKRFGLDLKNSIIIFDDAHNLESFCEKNTSAELTSNDLALCIKELEKVSQLAADGKMARTEDDIAEGLGIGSPKIGDLSAVSKKIAEIGKEMEKIFNCGKLKNVRNVKGKSTDGRVALDMFKRIGLEGRSLEKFVDTMNDAISFLILEGEKDVLDEKGNGMEKMCNFILAIMSTQAEDVSKTPTEPSSRVGPGMQKEKSTLRMVKGRNGKIRTNYYWFETSATMKMVKALGVRSIICASATLSPIQHFVSNMGLEFLSVLENVHGSETVPIETYVVTKGYRGELTGSFSNRMNPDYLSDVGEVLMKVFDATPQGVVVFFSSFTHMDQFVRSWKSVDSSKNVENLYERMNKKKKIFIESKARNKMESRRYLKEAQSSKGAAFFGVCVGKVCKQVDFWDSGSRAVVIIGMPYPSTHDERVILKQSSIDMARKKEPQRQSSEEWRQMEAFRVVNQAIGQILKHTEDFGAVVLVDSRYATAKLEMFPKWLRKTISKGDAEGCFKQLLQFFEEQKLLMEDSKIDLAGEVENGGLNVAVPANTNFFHVTTLLSEYGARPHSTYADIVKKLFVQFGSRYLEIESM